MGIVSCSGIQEEEKPPTRYSIKPLQINRQWVEDGKLSSSQIYFRKQQRPTLPLLTDACQQRLFGYLIPGSEHTNAQLSRSLNPRYLSHVLANKSAHYTLKLCISCSWILFSDTFTCAKMTPKGRVNKAKLPKELRKLKHSNFQNRFKS